jgi:hypothetical protein
MLDISNTVHKWHSSALTVFALAENPLWVPPAGLVFVMSNNVIYGSPVSILFMAELDLWLSAEGGGRWNTVHRCMRLKHRSSIRKCSSLSLLAAFIAVWHIRYCFALAYWHILWQWRIGYVLQSTIFCNIFIDKASGGIFHSRVWGYIIGAELVNIA